MLVGLKCQCQAHEEFFHHLKGAVFSENSCHLEGSQKFLSWFSEGVFPYSHINTHKRPVTPETARGGIEIHVIPL